MSAGATTHAFRPEARPFPPEVEESGATGAVARLYEDIREVGGYGAVPLFFRCLAARPEALAWGWSVLRPGYLSGEVAAWADLLPIPGQNAARIARPVLAAQGITDEMLSQARRITRAFNAANPKNLIAATVLHEAVHGGHRPVWRGIADQPAESVPTLPAPVTLASLGPAEREMLDWLAGSGRGDAQTLNPTLYRMLALWPPLLTLVACRLDPLFADGSLDRDATALRDEMPALIRSGRTMPDSQVPDDATDLLRQVSAAFMERIPQMLIVGAVIEALLAREEDV